MRRLLSLIVLALLAASCQTMTPEESQSQFVVFFNPASSELSMPGQEIVRRAARNAMSMHATRIELAFPADAPGRPLTEGRFTAIQNVFSASGIDVALLQRVFSSAMGVELPGGTDRVEIKLQR